jgi:hypothetical protein
MEQHAADGTCGASAGDTVQSVIERSGACVIPTLKDAEEQIIFNGPAATHARLAKLGGDIINIAYTIRDRAFAFESVNDLIIPFISKMTEVVAAIKSTRCVVIAGADLELTAVHCYNSFCCSKNGSLKESQRYLLRACHSAISSLRLTESRVRGRPLRALPGQGPSLVAVSDKIRP